MTLRWTNTTRTRVVAEHWIHFKEYVIAAFTGFVGWVVYKIKNKDTQQREHEAMQDKRLDNLERRAHSLEKNQGIIEERTKSIQNELTDMKLEVRSDLKEIKDILRNG